VSRFQLHYSGRFRALQGGLEVDLPKSKKSRAILAFLGIAKHPVPRQRLVDLFFSDVADPKGALRWSISRLRATLGKEVFDSTQGRLAIAHRDFDTDIDSLRRQPLLFVRDFVVHSSGAVGTPTEFLTDLSLPSLLDYEAWRLTQQASLVTDLHSALRLFAQQQIGHQEGLAAARTLVEINPEAEASWAALIQHQVSNGEHQEAKRTSELARIRLRQDGITVTGELDLAMGSSVGRATRQIEPVGGVLGCPRMAIAPCYLTGADTSSLSRLAVDVQESLYRASASNKALAVVAGILAPRGDTAQYARDAERLGVEFILLPHLRQTARNFRVAIDLVSTESLESIASWRMDFADSVSESEASSRLEAHFAARFEIDIPIALVSRAAKKSPQQHDQYDEFYLALPLLFDPKGFNPQAAYVPLEQVVSRHADFVLAASLMALIRMFLPQYNSSSFEIDRTISLARAALSIDQDNPLALGLSAIVLGHLENEKQVSFDLVQRAQSVNPHSILGGIAGALVAHFAGDEVAARAYLDKLDDTSELFPLGFFVASIRAMSFYQEGEYSQAVSWARQTISHNPTYIVGLRYLAASLGQLGEVEEARAVAQRMIEIDPSEHIEFFQRHSPYAESDATRHLIEGLRSAGLATRS